MVSLMTMTCSFDGVSRSVKSRPARNGIPIDLK